MNKKITLIGTGMNGFETMLPSAVKAVYDADVLIGAKRMTGMFSKLNKPVFESYSPHDISEYVQSTDFKNIAVLLSGDCGFYSGAKKLLPLLKDFDTSVICGISTPVYLCSKIKAEWSQMCFLSLHGSNGNIVRNVCMNEWSFLLLGGEVTPNVVCERLCEYNMSYVRVYIGENLGSENERISIGNPADFLNMSFSRLSAMIIENKCCERYIESCIPDSRFIRDKVPMTKSEVRCIAVSKLHVGRSSICWDIGCGTGSVSVEMALRCFDGVVYAVDKKTEAVELTDKNRHEFRCDNINIVSGNAEEMLDTLPKPDCVFIGGSGGSLEAIIQAALGKNPNVQIVVTAVSLETLNEAVRCFDTLGVQINIQQVAVTKTHKLGSHTMFKAENPVFIIDNTK